MNYADENSDDEIEEIEIDEWEEIDPDDVEDTWSDNSEQPKDDNQKTVIELGQPIDEIDQDKDEDEYEVSPSSILEQIDYILDERVKDVIENTEINIGRAKMSVEQLFEMTESIFEKLQKEIKIMKEDIEYLKNKDKKSISLPKISFFGKKSKKLKKRITNKRLKDKPKEPKKKTQDDMIKDIMNNPEELRKVADELERKNQLTGKNVNTTPHIK